MTVFLIYVIAISITHISFIQSLLCTPCSKVDCEPVVCTENQILDMDYCRCCNTCVKKVLGK